MQISRIIYIIWSFVVIILAYTLPYTVPILKNAQDISLYIFWSIVATLHIMVTILYLRRSFIDGDTR